MTDNKNAQLDYQKDLDGPMAPPGRSRERHKVPGAPGLPRLTRCASAVVRHRGLSDAGKTRSTRNCAALACAALLLAALLPMGCERSEKIAASTSPAAGTNATPAEVSVELSSNQLNTVRIEPVGTFLFPI